MKDHGKPSKKERTVVSHLEDLGLIFKRNQQLFQVELRETVSLTLHQVYRGGFGFIINRVMQEEDRTT